MFQDSDLGIPSQNMLVILWLVYFNFYILLHVHSSHNPGYLRRGGLMKDTSDKIPVKFGTSVDLVSHKMPKCYSGGHLMSSVG